MFNDIPPEVRDCSTEQLLKEVCNRMEASDGLDPVPDSIVGFCFVCFQSEVAYRAANAKRD